MPTNFSFSAFSRSGEVIRHPALDIGPFAIEVALGFENGPADQRIETTANLRDAPLEIEGFERNGKFLDK